MYALYTLCTAPTIRFDFASVRAPETEQRAYLWCKRYSRCSCISRKRKTHNGWYTTISSTCRQTFMLSFGLIAAEIRLFLTLSVYIPNRKPEPARMHAELSNTPRHLLIRGPTYMRTQSFAVAHSHIYKTTENFC